MADPRTGIVPVDFDALSKRQKAFVRKLAWEMLKETAPFVVVIPSVIGGLGLVIGIVAGVVLGRLVFSEHFSLTLLVCIVIGAGIGAWVGQNWVQRECQSHFREIMRDHGDEISQII